MTLQAVSSALWIVLGLALITAGLAKARNENPFVVQVGRLFPARVWRGAMRPRIVARGVWVIEIATGAAMFALAGAPVLALASWVTAVFATFVVVTVILYRRGLPCGCFGASTAPAPDRAALWRSALLAAGAGFVLVLAAVRGTVPLHGNDAEQMTVAALAFALLVFGPASIRFWARRIAAPARIGAAMADESGDVTDQPTRRAFLVRAAAGIAALVSYGMLAQSAAASAGPPDCMAYYIECGACCGMNQSCAACCSGCYYFCRFFSGGPCMATCNGCWPG